MFNSSNAQEHGRKGGSAKSTKKLRAAKANGKRGGRQVTQRFNQFVVRKNELLREFHQKLAAWAELKQRTSQSVEHVIALPTLPPA
jgi:hypothetical protein